MTDYLSYSFIDSPEFVNTYDELPLWSAPFGLLMLKHLELKQGLTVLDIGSGTGFPLIELAGRLGNSCKLYGMDPWVNANARAKQKIRNYGLTNVEMIEGSAEKIPFDDQSVDLIVSNLGINNFEKPQTVFKDCSRVLKQNGKLALTTNLNGHWKEFYMVFEDTLRQSGRDHLIALLIKQQEHRGSFETVSKLFTDSRLSVCRHEEGTFEMKFLNGSAFLNHYFVKLGWMQSWKDLLPENERAEIFSLLEKNLNLFSTKSNGLNLTVPMLFIEGEKV